MADYIKPFAWASWRIWDERRFSYLDCFCGLGPDDPLPIENSPLVVGVRTRPLKEHRE